MTKREDHIRNRTASIQHEYATHEIVEYSEHAGLGRWLLKKRYPDGKTCSDMWAEVIEGRGGYLHVGGDIAACVFGICGSANPKPGNMVYWMARRTPADPYMHEKLRIGMSRGAGFDPAMDFDPEVAVEDIDAHIADAANETSDDEDSDESDSRLPDKVLEELHEVREDLLNGESDQNDMIRRLYNVDMDIETIEHWGLVPSSRIICAWGALCRLRDLLDAKTKDAE